MKVEQKGPSQSKSATGGAGARRGRAGIAGKRGAQRGGAGEGGRRRRPVPQFQSPSPLPAQLQRGRLPPARRRSRDGARARASPPESFPGAMNPNCARCGKIVYPTEKVNCLDKFWHKACFHCETCKMTLNMKNYKGYEKKPYCNAHYPKQSFTMVADTPENLRLKQQSELQSQVRYKEEFEKNKGKGFSVLADTPELQRVRKTQDQISNIKYHEEFEKSRMGPSGGEGVEPERRDAQESSSFRRPPEQQQTQPHHIPTSAPVYQQPQQQQVTPSYGGYKEPAAPVSIQRSAAGGGGKRYRAVYDYSAADEDEVSFQDGDTIVNVQQIDDGWMYGTVERTGDTGMLPANYVEAI